MSQPSRGRARGRFQSDQPPQAVGRRGEPVQRGGGGVPRPGGNGGGGDRQELMSVGRAKRQDEPPAAGGDMRHPHAANPPAFLSTTVVGGGDEPCASAGRRGGAVAGTRGKMPDRLEIVHTKPEMNQTKKGSMGQPVTLQANYFELIQHQRWCLQQYRVDFDPDVDDTRNRKMLLRTALKDVLTGYLFDGTVLYTPHVLQPMPLEKLVEDQSGQPTRVAIRHVGDVAYGDPHYVMIFNLIIRKCLAYMKLETIGRDYYDPGAKIRIPEHKLELWPGYATSMRQHESKILLNAEITFKVLRTDNVYDLLMEAQQRDEFRRRVLDTIVLTYYNNRTYRIDDVDFETHPTSTFPGKDNRQVTYLEYYQTKYNIKIRVQDQPMLVSRSKPREIRAGMPEVIYLVPELCQMTGLTDEQRSNFQLMKALGNHTRVNPGGRLDRVRQFCQRLRSCPEAMAELQRWDMQIAQQVVTLTGREIAREKIMIANNQAIMPNEEADWTRDLRNLRMLNTGDMRMAVIVPSRLQGQGEEFVQALDRAAKGMSWRCLARTFVLDRDATNNYLQMIEQVLNEKPTLIMCVLATATVDRYSAIKKKCIVDRGIPSQVVLGKTISNAKGLMSVATKVAIQLNCKIGGAPWAVNIPISGLMIIGYDVCRDTTKKGKSYGAMVASLDKFCTRYVNYVTEHTGEEELSHNFAANIIQACMAYREVNGQLPDKFMIYRDGVGDGQIRYVFEQEVKSIVDQLKSELFKEQPFKLTFVIVSKRISTRLFKGTQNPVPGTVVDDVITMPERYDFYMVSQCVRQGTVAPTSYNVIYDTLGLPVDRLQALTYKLCHMYFNWSGTLRVPAPCQYAHKLAFFAAKFLHRQPHRDLRNLLFYL